MAENLPNGCPAPIKTIENSGTRYLYIGCFEIEQVIVNILRKIL